MIRGIGQPGLTDASKEVTSAEDPLPDDSNVRDRISKKILGYLLAHPAAADSTDGIRHWWLLNDDQAGEVTVRAALDALASREWLVAYGADVQSRIYALNELKIDAIRQFVDDSGGPLNG